MKLPSWLRLRATPPTLGALAVVLLAVLSLVGPLAAAPRLGPLGWWLAFVGLAALAGLHRPFGGRGPAVGVAALPPLTALAGPLAAAWGAFAAVAAAELLRTRLPCPLPLAGPHRWRPAASLTAAARAAFAALAAGVVWRAVSSAEGGPPVAAPWRAGFAGGAVFVAVVLVFRVADRDWRRRGVLRPEPETVWRSALRWLPPAAEFGSIAVEAAAWAAGTVVAAAALAAGAAGASARGLALALVAVVAVLAVEAARLAGLRAASEERLGQLDRVRDAGRRITGSTVELEAVVDRIREECANVVPFGWFQFDVPAGDGRAGRSWSAEQDAPLADGPAGPPAHPPPIPGIHKRPEWRLIERPLAWNDRAEAYLTLWCDPRRIEGDDVELLDALLPQMSASLRQSLLDREAREDRLTGAVVRRVLERHLLSTFRSAADEGRTLAVIMCDLDHFKPINDTFGHLAGDRALSLVGNVLARHKRTVDLFARYGGEEFTLLLDDADGDAALAVAERLRAAVETIDFEVDGTPVPLRISAGVAAFPELTVKTATELLLLADAALYEAKRRGRNRCLLDLGGGRYRTVGGEVVEVEERRKAQEAPRIFA